MAEVQQCAGAGGVPEWTRGGGAGALEARY